MSKYRICCHEGTFYVEECRKTGLLGRYKWAHDEEMEPNFDNLEDARKEMQRLIRQDTIKNGVVRYSDD